MQKYRIVDSNDPLYREFEAIYAVSFPVHEQRNEVQQAEAFADPRYFLETYGSEEQLAAFMAGWQFDGYIYIEHLAVSPQLRGRNIGSEVLQEFAAEHPEAVILLEIDPLVDEVSRKRLRFYEKLGFRINPYPHFHPPYDPAFPPHALIVLSLPREISPVEYQIFRRDLAQVVMKAEE